MTRFDASTPDDRRQLIVEAITAHRDRASPYVTFEADQSDHDEQSPPWVQYRLADGLVNVDCTDPELDRMKTVLDRYPEFRIIARQQPEHAEGTNVRIEGYTDEDRLARFIDQIFRSVYGYDDEYRLWVAEL